MLRVILEPLALFSLPFVAYALFVLSAPEKFDKNKAWSAAHVSGLMLAGLAAAVAGLLLFGVTAQRHQGAYKPAHVENGNLVPGHLD